MGKKSRRKREKTLNFLRQNAAETVDVVEEEDPSYKTIENRPREIAQLTLKHRFGGAHITSGNLRCVKIRSGVQRLRHHAVLFRGVPARALARSPEGVP